MMSERPKLGCGGIGLGQQSFHRKHTLECGSHSKEVLCVGSLHCNPGRQALQVQHGAKRFSHTGEHHLVAVQGLYRRQPPLH